MKRELCVLLLGSALLSGCAPLHRRAAMCPPNPCGPGNSYYLASQPCGTSEVIISSGAGSPMSAVPSSSGLEGRVNSIENNLDSMRNDIGTMQRQNNQIERKIDRLLDDYVPPK